MKTIPQLKQDLISALDQQDCRPGHFDALLLIDVQRRFCHIDADGNEDTEHVASVIGNLTPQFRAAGLPVYAVYNAEAEQPAEEIDFYGYEYHPSDHLVHKDHLSAFANNTLGETLRDRDHKNILVMGVYAGGCVASTVKDGLNLRYLNIWIAPDAIASRSCFMPYYYEDMHRQGAKIISSAQALHIAQNQNALVLS